MEKKAAAKKQSDYNDWKAAGYKAQGNARSYDDKIGYEAMLGKVQYNGMGYAERILGLPPNTFTSAEQAAKALNEGFKAQYKPPTFAPQQTAPTVNVSQEIPLQGGDKRIIFSSGTERPILLNGETVLASASEAVYDAATNTYKTQLRVRREEPGKQGKTIITYEPVETDDYGIYRNFAVDIKSKDPEPKEVKGNQQKSTDKTKNPKYKGDNVNIIKDGKVVGTATWDDAKGKYIAN
jgi:hypothetical protein